MSILWAFIAAVAFVLAARAVVTVLEVVIDAWLGEDNR